MPKKLLQVLTWQYTSFRNISISCLETRRLDLETPIIVLIINKRTRKQKILRLCMAREPRCMFWLLSWPVSTSVAKVTLNLNYCIVYKNKNTPLYSIRWHRVTIIIIIFLLFYFYVKIIITHQKYRTIPWTTRQLEENGVWTLPTSGHLFT